jgi:hypothetical protein
MYRIRYTNSLRFLPTLMSRNLWVLPVLINTMTLSFFMCHFNLRVCGWLMLWWLLVIFLVCHFPWGLTNHFGYFPFLQLLILMNVIHCCFFIHKYIFFLNFFLFDTCVLGLVSLHCVYIFLPLFFGYPNFLFYIIVGGVVCIFIFFVFDLGYVHYWTKIGEFWLAL